MRVFYLSVLCVCGLFTQGSASVFLLNDSPFMLKATIVAANGQNLGDKEVAQNQSMYFEDQLGSSNPTGVTPPGGYQNYANSLTPYTVFWYCKEGNLYSVCENVGAGALASANAGQGTKYCKIPPKTANPNQEQQE